MEEAITSSQLEGANTTRKEAKRMLQEGRKPRNIDERMIMNNYRAMKTIEESLKNERLSEEKLLELHGILTEDTLEDKKEEGAYRRDGKKGKQKIVVEDAVSQEVVFISPPSSFSGKEMMNLIQYANDEQEEAGFIHPVIKAIILHFWLGYLHPFVDGNGRMARAIFYWYLLRHGYWGFSYLSLSKTIKSSPSQYRNAYLYTENDDNDLTYFIEYNLRKILVSLRNFRKYRDRYMSENKKVSAVARQKYGLNDRQIQLLRFLSQKENESATIKMHMNVNDITRATAVKDVHALQKLGFLKSKRIGKEKHYFGTAKLEKIFNQ
jgi:Fic family protein